MEDLKLNELSNAELKLKIKGYENEYEVIKNKIDNYINRMNELDKLYNNCKMELKKRNVI